MNIFKGNFHRELDNRTSWKKSETPGIKQAMKPNFDVNFKIFKKDSFFRFSEKR